MRWDADYTGQNCVGLVGANFTNVNECANGDKGKQLQLEAEKETHLIAKPYPSFVPTVVYNKVSLGKDTTLCKHTGSVFQMPVTRKARSARQSSWLVFRVRIAFLYLYLFHCFFYTYTHTQVFNRRKQSRSQWELRNVICEELELIRSEEDLPEMCLSRRAIKT